MLALRFEHPGQGEALTVGPAPYFRIEGRSLRAGPADEEVGHYEGGAWHLGERTFLTATAESPARVHFEGDGEPCAGAHGPFAQVRLVDGAIRHGPQSHGLLAKYDEEAQSWYVYAEQKSCPAAVLSPG